MCEARVWLRHGDGGPRGPDGGGGGGAHRRGPAAVRHADPSRHLCDQAVSLGAHAPSDHEGAMQTSEFMIPCFGEIWNTRKRLNYKSIKRKKFTSNFAVVHVCVFHVIRFVDHLVVSKGRLPTTPEEARRAVETLHNYELDGRPIKVVLAPANAIAQGGWGHIRFHKPMLVPPRRRLLYCSPSSIQIRIARVFFIDDFCFLMIKKLYFSKSNPKNAPLRHKKTIEILRVDSEVPPAPVPKKTAASFSSKLKLSASGEAATPPHDASLLECSRDTVLLTNHTLKILVLKTQNPTFLQWACFLSILILAPFFVKDDGLFRAEIMIHAGLGVSRTPHHKPAHLFRQ